MGDVEKTTASTVPQAGSVDDPFRVDESPAPVIIENGFNPADIVGCDPAAWVAMLQGLAPRLPVQLHCEPHEIANTDDPDCQPIFRRTVEMLKKYDSLSDLTFDKHSSGDPNRARIKFRLAKAGKFVHRNRYSRRQILCCLYGEQWWLFLSSHGGGADQYLNRDTNDNWNGFRSLGYPSRLTLEEMRKIESEVPEGVIAKVVKFKAGDIMTFDGRWWHATSYTAPVLNLFFTPGKDMEVAVKEHKRRMAMPMQKGLKLSTINMAKCSKLSSAWTTTADGQKIDWNNVKEDTSGPVCD